MLTGGWSSSAVITAPSRRSEERSVGGLASEHPIASPFGEQERWVYDVTAGTLPMSAGRHGFAIVLITLIDRVTVRRRASEEERTSMYIIT